MHICKRNHAEIVHDEGWKDMDCPLCAALAKIARLEEAGEDYEKAFSKIRNLGHEDNNDLDMDSVFDILDDVAHYSA